MRERILIFDAVVFDFDGVLVESLDVKTRAFATLFRQYGKKIVEKVVAYHVANSGISRHIKFQYYHETLLGIPYNQAIGEQLSKSFSKITLDAVANSPYVTGAREFLEEFHRQLPLFVASGTPQEELREILRLRGMQDFFKAAYGSPASKSSIILDIVRRHNLTPARLLMIGDATADYIGACEAGASFIGRVIHNTDSPFPANVTTIPDLTKLAKIVCLSG